MRLARWARAARLRAGVEEQAAFYRRPWTTTAADSWQLEQLNQGWREYSARVPRYAELRRQGRVPLQFSSWSEFEERVPATSRADLQANMPAHIDGQRPPEEWRATGGSTAAPLRSPAWRSERVFHAADFWLGRSWFGVAPDDRLALLWGHAHLLGSGLRAVLAGWRREAQDRLLGYRRISAYDLSEVGMRAAARAVIEFRPTYVLGYAVALDRFARVNRAEAAAFHALRLKVAVATAESFPQPDSAALVSSVLGCPVAMEYGAIETGPLAQQRSDGTYAVFWSHYRLEGVPSAEVPGAEEILVTSLYPRCLPLVRYRIGDLVRRTDEGEISRTFREVVGRCNESLRLADGGLVHSEAFAHALRGGREISSYQLVQTGNDVATLLYTGVPLATEAEVEVRRRLGRIAPALATICLEHRETLPQTIAGKTPRLRRQD